MSRQRLTYLAIFLACTSLLGFGYYLQFVEYLEPCPLCMVQRLVYLLIAITTLAAAIHNPGRGAVLFYSSILDLLALFGAVVAGRQIWLQHLPADKVPECGPGLDFMLDTYPFLDVVRTLIRGTGDCAEVVWTFLGFSIAEWSLLMFVAIMVVNLWLLLGVLRGR